jgi:asparagine synthase (glutamine-hydrolysing)
MVATQAADIERFREEFQKIKHRGPDKTEILDMGAVLGFHRLSIMDTTDSGMQPFERNGSYLVCNGEIYGFRKMRDRLKERGYSFGSDSDCEILLPMYEQYGLGMFAMLDAEFALVMYDAGSGGFVAARDPIGIRPLFYGYGAESGGIMFASEAKSLVGLCGEVSAFPPGHYYADGKFTQYRDPAVSSYKGEDGLEDIFKNIKAKLTDGIIKRLDADVELGFLLSGGLDSSLVCSVAARYLGKPIKTFAIGMAADAIDLKYAKIVADYIGSEHYEVLITEKDVLATLDRLIYHLETWDITTIRAAMGMYLLCKWIGDNTDVKVLLTGEISDELFGYKYTDFAPGAGEFQRESEKRIRELYMYDVLRADRCISAASLEARVPFGDLDFVDYVMGIDPAKKMNVYGKGKYLLRMAFKDGYLPEEILMREKAAFSDAVGHSLVDILKAHAESLYTEEEFAEKIRSYPGNTPFTKESLLYREIFERHFSGRGGLIAGFWMPNKSWEGCDVDDPSARVLSNYGASGS